MPEPLALAVALEDRDDLGLERGEVRRVLEEHLRERAAGVDGVRVEVEQDVALGEPAVERRHLTVRRRGLEHLPRVLRIEDREVGGQPEPRPETAEQPVADGVERAAHETPRVHGQQHLDAAQHLAGRLVREREQEDPGGVEPVLDEPRDPVDERPGLARARAGDHEERAVTGHDDVPLLVVELAVVVDPVGLQTRGRLEDVFPFHGSSLEETGAGREPSSREPCGVRGRRWEPAGRAGW